MNFFKKPAMRNRIRLHRRWKLAWYLRGWSADSFKNSFELLASYSWKRQRSKAFQGERSYRLAWVRPLPSLLHRLWACSDYTKHYKISKKVTWMWLRKRTELHRKNSSLCKHVSAIVLPKKPQQEISWRHIKQWFHPGWLCKGTDSVGDLCLFILFF